MTNATLTITRKSSFNAVLREAAILVDEQKVGVVGNGKSIEVSIAPGQHTIRARMDWLKCKPLELTAFADERYRAELTLCNPFLALFAIIGLVPYMELRAQ